MILSDRTIREALDSGRIVIDPLDTGDIQPSSVDLHIDRYFRVFRNHTMRVIDVKEDQEELTELVEMREDDPFILHPGEFVLGSTLERVKLPDDLVARLEGKALALTTEVPTPRGWTTMGDLIPGDEVFHPSGRPVCVLAVTAPMVGRRCYEVAFSDHSTVIADAAHLWATTTKAGKRRRSTEPSLVTTEDMAASLAARKERNHHVALCGAVEYEDSYLEIAPYVLGAWLGDGTSTAAVITSADPEIVAEIERCGYPVKPLRRNYQFGIGQVGHARHTQTGRYIPNESFSSTLKRIGLWGHKHVPDEYLTASTPDRLALLQGLMDTDGYVDESGRCEYISILEPLADAVVELAASLGLRPVKRKKRATLNGVDCGPAYQVKFTPHIPVFRLSRKLARQKPSTTRFHHFRAVTAVRPCESVPVKCIQVAAPDGMFLVGRTYIPTHNSSLGRLGLLIHSSLPGSEPVMVLVDGQLLQLPIEQVVRKQVSGSVIGFDRQTFEVGYFPITGWYEGPPDRIYEVRLASGRSVRVTAGHNLFTLERDGRLTKTRTAALQPGTRVAIPRRIPSPDLPRPILRVLDLAPECADDLYVEGPTVAAAFDDPYVRQLLEDFGYRHDDYYRRRSCLPVDLARVVEGLVDALGPEDRVRAKGGRNGVPAVIEVDAKVAWLLGIYVAEGYRRRQQVVISNTDEAILDRAQAVLATLGLPVYRADGKAITCSSVALSSLLGWLGIGDGAHHKRLPVGAFGWPRDIQESLLEGMMDGDGSQDDPMRESYWTSSPGLAADVLVLMELLGRRAAAYHRDRINTAGLFQVAMPRTEHKLLTSVPLADRLLVRLREEAGLTQAGLSERCGFSHASDLNNIERRLNRDAVRLRTLRRLRDGLRDSDRDSDLSDLDRLIDGDIAWDEVIAVEDTGAVEPIFDLSVDAAGRPVENFLAGSGGVLVANTAGFVDAGWDGQLTLELSNVANLPITLYPGMKIGQISFLEMTTPAEHPYGSGAVGSKYQHQVGPRPSRYFENFRKRQ